MRRSLIIGLALALLGAGLRAGADVPMPLAGSHILYELYKDKIEAFLAGPREALPKDQAKKGIPVGGYETFWSIDMAQSAPFQLRAQLRKVGASCYIYVQDGYNVDQATVDRLASEFDTKIYPTDRAYFGSEWTPGIDWDPRITLLLMDIQDGWTPGKGYVAGYFFPLDEASTRLFPQSNEREIFYLDLYPGDPTRADYLGVLAHEFQHMIHSNHDRRETRWLNEAFAQIAFYVNGYGHAPQIFSFCRATDSALTEFDNGLDDYGSVYLWTYYVLTKFGGATPEAQQAFCKAMVGSTKKSMESFTEVLAGLGAPSADAIFQDWAIANVANAPTIEGGKYGYDETLRFAVQPSTVHTFKGSTGKVKGSVEPWAADYLTFVAKELYRPLNPTMVDRITMLAEGNAAEIRWTVNGGQLPPDKLVPAGSRIENGRVITPVADGETGRGVVVGPFARLGTPITSVEFFNGAAEVSASIFTLEQLTESFLAERAKGFEFKFSGKAEHTVTAVVKGSTGTEIVPVSGKFQRASLAGVESITFVVVGNPNGEKKPKPIEYSYSATGNGVEGVQGELARAARLRQIEDAAAELAVSDEGAKALLASVSSERRKAEEAIASRMLATGGEDALAAVGTALGADRTEKARMAASAKAALRMAKFRAMDTAQEQGVPAEELAAIETSGRQDDDQSHDNMGYLLFKAGEVVYSLEHLKIDAMIEGQILQLWKLLEIAKGFPHLPIPDGLNVADYDLSKIKELMGQWATDFQVPWQGPAPAPSNGDRTAARADQEDVKQVLRRLKLAGEIVEFAYDNNLTMAEDVTISVYDFTRLVFGAWNVSKDIAKIFEKIPGVGKAVKYIKALIHRKLVRVIEIVLVMISSKMKPPYSTWGPLVISLVAYVYNKVMGLPDDPNDPYQQNGGMKEMAVKLAGKYALTATPKFGYIKKGAPVIELAAQYTGGLVHEGTLEDAQKAVWDDQDASTNGAVREQLAAEMVDAHGVFLRNRKIFDITRRLVTIGQYASAIDPSNISKVLTVVAAAASTGLCGHSAYRTGTVFFGAQKKFVDRGIRLAFDPGQAPAEAAEHGKQMRASSAFIDGEIARVELAHQGFEEALREARAAAGFRAEALAAKASDMSAQDERMVAAAEKLEAADAELDASLGNILALGLLAEGEAMVAGDDLVSAATAESLARADLGAKVFSRMLGVGSAGDDPSGADAWKSSMTRLVGALQANLQALRSSDVDATVVVSKSAIESAGAGKLKITATVSNPSSEAIGPIAVGLQSGFTFGIEGPAAASIGRLGAGESTEVSFTIVPQEELGLFPLVSIVPEAEGVKGVGKLQLLLVK